MRRLFISAVFLELFTVSIAAGAPTEAETAAFYAERRAEKLSFDRSIAAETDSRTAAVQEFNLKQRADRIAFQRTIPDRPTAADIQRFEEFNAGQLKKQNDFNRSLPSLPLNTFEQEVVDFDKKALADRNALIEELSAAHPEVRAETLRQFQNDLLQKRAQLKNNTLNEAAKRQRQFKADQARKVQEFFDS